MDVRQKDLLEQARMSKQLYRVPMTEARPNVDKSASGIPVLELVFAHAAQCGRRLGSDGYTSYMDYNQMRLKEQDGPVVRVYPGCLQCVVEVPRAVLEEAVARWRLGDV